MKNTYDIHALQFAYDVTIKLCKENTHKADAHAVLIKLATIFSQAITDADLEQEKLRKELETPRSINEPAHRELPPEVGFPSSQAAANWMRSLTKQARTWSREDGDSGAKRSWNDYVDDHCDKMKNEDLREANVPDSEFGDE